MRHRVGRHFLNFKLVPHDEDEGYSWLLKESLGMDAMSITTDESRSAMEEVFTVGNEIEHLGDINESSFQKLLQEHINSMEKNGIDKNYLTTWGISTDGKDFNPYKHYADVYYIIKTKIPDFLEISPRIRAGRKGARRELSQKIVEQFGKEGLAGIVYADNNHRADLSHLYIYHCHATSRSKSK